MTNRSMRDYGRFADHTPGIVSEGACCGIVLPMNASGSPDTETEFETEDFFVGELAEHLFNFAAGLILALLYRQ